MLKEGVSAVFNRIISVADEAPNVADEGDSCASGADSDSDFDEF